MTDTRPETWDGPPGQPCECPNLAGDCDGAHAEPLPDAAITAAADVHVWAAAADAISEAAEKHGMTFLSMYPALFARVALEAAAPALRKAERERCQAYLRDAAAEHRDLAIEHAYETNTLIARTIDELADLLEGTDG